MTSEANSSTCPLLAIDRRLSDVHRYWHEAESNYFDPDLFRSSIQTAIQTLRTVTFLIQSHKRIFTNFDAWYGTWQENLRKDPLMRWMVDARNTIEKQGDLETHSFIKADLLASYYDEGPSWKIPAELFESPNFLMQSTLTEAEANHVEHHGVLRIQRRWVENSLPDYELLDAVSIAYGAISKLLKDAHVVLGLDANHFNQSNTHCKHPLSTDSGCLSCMISSRQSRTLYIHMASGKPIKCRTTFVDGDQSQAEAAALRYEIDKDSYKGLETKDAEAKLSLYFDLARKMFLVDGGHMTAVFFLKAGEVVHMQQLVFEDKATKYVVMRSIASQAAKTNSDSVIMISEVWSYKLDKGKLWSDPLNDPNRKEHLSATLLTKDGEPVRLSAEIHRSGDEVFLGPTEVSRNEVLPSFAPLYTAWGREIPSKWIEATHASQEETAK